MLCVAIQNDGLGRFISGDSCGAGAQIGEGDSN